MPASAQPIEIYNFGDLSLLNPYLHLSWKTMLQVLWRERCSGGGGNTWWRIGAFFSTRLGESGFPEWWCGRNKGHR